MQLFTKGKWITLNDDQIEALKTIESWYKSDRLFFTLSGPAGSGKTTIVKKALEGFKKPYRISAPTHKACKVVAKATDMFSMTIQALCGLMPDTNIEDVNERKFVPKNDPKIKDYNIIIIDEASMLGKEILQLILELAGQFRTKVLFMGDVYQLPPVKEKQSLVFSHPEIELYQLTKVERQQGSNPLMKIYDSIRGNIHEDLDQFSHKTAVTESGEGAFFYKEGKEFFNSVMEAFSSPNFAEDPNYAKVIAWRNETVNNWNQYIRKHIFHDAEDPIVEGEILMSYTHIYDEVMNTNLITNSAEYKVDSIKRDEVAVNGMILQVFKVVLKDIDDVNPLPAELNILVPDYDNYTNFIRVWHPMMESAKKFKAWRSYFRFKNRFLLMEELKDSEGKRILKKDIDYAYALTCHKSQGSTFTNVYVHEDDIDRNSNPTERNQLKYVAFSRPTTQAHIMSCKTIEDGSNISRKEAQRDLHSA